MGGVRHVRPSPAPFGAGLEGLAAFVGAEDALDRQDGRSRSRSARAAASGSGRHRPLRAGPGDLAPLHSISPRGQGVRPAMRLSSVGCRSPEWPISETNSPWRDLEIDVAQGDERPFGVEAHADVFDLDDCVRNLPGPKIIDAVAEAAGDQQQQDIRAAGRRCRSRRWRSGCARL